MYDCYENHVSVYPNCKTPCNKSMSLERTVKGRDMYFRVKRNDSYYDTTDWQLVECGPQQLRLDCLLHNTRGYILGSVSREKGVSLVTDLDRTSNDRSNE